MAASLLQGFLDSGFRRRDEKGRAGVPSPRREKVGMRGTHATLTPPRERGYYKGSPTWHGSPVPPVVDNVILLKP